MREIIVEKEFDGIRLNKFLQKKLPFAPLGILYKQLRNKNITLNNKKTSAEVRLKTSDVLQIFFSDDTFNKFSFNDNSPIENISFSSFENFENNESIKSDIIYEDENIILFNKPCGLLSQKAKDIDFSLNEILKEYSKCNNGAIVNRLDRNTTGLIIFGKNYESCRELSNLIKNRDIEKTYHAILCGKFDSGNKEILLEGFLKKDEKTNTVSIYKNKVENSKEIKTICKTLRYNKDKNLTLVELKLLTGATHQIRAQLANEGYAILGDKKYSNNKFNLSKFYPSYKYCLHSFSIKFGDFINDDLKYLSGKFFRTSSPEWENII